MLGLHVHFLSDFDRIRRVNETLLSGSVSVLQMFVEHRKFDLSSANLSLVGRAPSSVSESMMAYLLSRQEDLSGAYVQAVDCGSAANLNILERLLVPFPPGMWSGDLLYRIGTDEVSKWIWERHPLPPS